VSLGPFSPSRLTHAWNRAVVHAMKALLDRLIATPQSTENGEPK
jgi:hypothetical protein